MKKTILAAVMVLAASGAWALDVAIKGSYTTRFENDRPNVIGGSLSQAVAGEWKGTLTTDWKGKMQSFTGTVTGDLTKGKVKGDFRLGDPQHGRRFVFTAKADNYTLKGPVVEIMKNGQEKDVGEIEMKGTPGASK